MADLADIAETTDTTGTNLAATVAMRTQGAIDSLVGAVSDALVACERHLNLSAEA